ncbi:unnamed protein product [Didymodactylos carnosus]|uniref:Defective in cullin neddylation protein n=1 Tax=Didymodactylos carnosus TaxID=1234261 RepID=A0A813UHQ7_9BILA|nr:unnamed protein product [Didymodactylos carnosus]CAF0942333.1 unnamed protein product [Didymodactylos carnosus]CAF3610373.1 unnamed protein product [Didymodactylos carnosus]CAF3717302.1 unnamed protein product [Didymodactylos carnosus]
MGQCLNKYSGQMSRATPTNASSIKHVKKKAKKDLYEFNNTTKKLFLHSSQDSSISQRNSLQQRTTNSLLSRTHHHQHQQLPKTQLEPRRDIPIHKIPELLAKITCHISPSSDKYSSQQHTTNSARAVQLSDQRIETLFESYCDHQATEKVINIDGIIRFCHDLQLNPESFEILVLAWIFRAQQMYQFTHDEFIGGFKTMKCDNINDLRTKLCTYLEQELLINDYLFYKDFYSWTYYYGLDRSNGQRNLCINIACSLWRLIYSEVKQRPRILDSWLNYLENVQTHIKFTTFDTWNVWPQFSKYIENNLDNYDDSEAWPCLFDEFVEYERQNKQQITTTTDSMMT